MTKPPSALAARGPHPVGLAELELTDPHTPGRSLATDVWYPAEAAEVAREERAEHPLGRPHEAVPGARRAEGRYPLVAFSHGNSGLRRQSTFLTTHLASWGFVVAAPDHAGNTFLEMLNLGEDERQQRHFEARRNRPRDLSSVIDAALAGGAWAAADRDRVGVLGHSFGGWTALKMPAADPRVRAVCGLAPASEPFVGRKAFAPDELPFEPTRPVLLVPGVDDVLVDLVTSVEPLFARMGEPRLLVGIHGADHFHFCDGIELLHGMHRGSPRQNQPRPTREVQELLDEARMHRLLSGLVTAFFRSALGDGGDSADTLDREALASLDPALRRLDEPGEMEEALRWQQR